MTYFKKSMFLAVLLCCSLNAFALFSEDNNLFNNNNPIGTPTTCNKKSYSARQTSKSTFTLSETTNASHGVSFSYRSNNTSVSNSSSTSEANAYQSNATNTMAETELYAQSSSAAFSENLNSMFTSNAQQRSLGGIGGGNEGKPNNPPVTPITDVPLYFLAILVFFYARYRKHLKTKSVEN